VSRVRQIRGHRRSSSSRTSCSFLAVPAATHLVFRSSLYHQLRHCAFCPLESTTATATATATTTTMPSFGNLQSKDGLKSLNDYLESCSYITGYTASADDARTYAQVSNNISRSEFPHVVRWASHIAALIAARKLQPVQVEAQVDSQHASSSSAAAAVTDAPAQEAKKDDDDFDLFGGDDDDDAAAAEELLKRKREEAAAKAAKGKKKDVVAKSTVVLDVKPMEAETDLDELEQLVRKITPEGLVWGACERVPMAYGIKFLRILCTIVDDLVSVDDLENEIQQLESVQTTDIYSFNKV